MKFRPKNEHELTKLEDDDLIEYAVQCRDAGDDQAFRDAISVFIYKRMPMVRARVGLKVPQEDVEELAGTIMVSALASISGISGTGTGEFVNWLKTITKFRIADYYRKKKDDPDFTRADSAGGDDEEFLLQLVDIVNDIEAIPLLDAIEKVLATRTDAHRLAIELRIEGYSSKEAADEVNLRIDPGPSGKPMTPANVDQLIRRFRIDAAEALGWEVKK